MHFMLPCLNHRAKNKGSMSIAKHPYPSLPSASVPNSMDPLSVLNRRLSLIAGAILKAKAVQISLSGSRAFSKTGSTMFITQKWDRKAVIGLVHEDSKGVPNISKKKKKKILAPLYFHSYHLEYGPIGMTGIEKLKILC